MPYVSDRLFHLLLALACCISGLGAQTTPAPDSKSSVNARLAPTRQGTAQTTKKIHPSVIWLQPQRPSAASFVTPGNFTLLQKDKMFTPHLLVVPVGSSVAFPNADPFFHNVFSLFDGRRFDLGLYEAGSTRSVVFSREGVSYIFCNIHSEMSAVVIALSTPYYALAGPQGEFHLNDVPTGDYELRVWTEGQKQSSLDRLSRRVHIAGDKTDLGEISSGPPDRQQHLNKFGRPYEPDPHPIY
jgi:plastocyanin